MLQNENQTFTEFEQSLKEAYLDSNITRYEIPLSDLHVPDKCDSDSQINFNLALEELTEVITFQDYLYQVIHEPCLNLDIHLDNLLTDI